MIPPPAEPSVNPCYPVLSKLYHFYLDSCLSASYSVNNMQNKTDIQTLSRLRQDLRRLVVELERSIKPVFGRGPLVKGTVCEMARKCGKPSCACSRGELHHSTILSWSHKGKTKLMSIPLERLVELREKSEEYRRLRSARAEVSASAKKMLAAIDQIERIRREEP